MQPMLLNQGIGSSSTITDSITVLIKETGSLITKGSKTVTVSTDGNIYTGFNVLPGNYYVVIKHRNSILTWSATTVNLNATTCNYDFTTAANKAYGNNQIQMETGVWAIYTGDINADNSIDSFDKLQVESDIGASRYGYFNTDLNGDGNIDIFDSPVLENNISLGIYSIGP
jgi:hypothetical protein